MSFLNSKLKIETPPVKWLNDHAPTHNTPDIAKLERKISQLVFIYDELMKPHKFHNVLSDASRYLATGFTHERFTLWKKRLGTATCAIALKSEFPITAPARPIMGELYAVRAYQLLELDKHKENEIVFNRERVNVVIPYRRQVTSVKGELISDEPRIAKVSAWMYRGIEEQHPIDNGFNYSPVTRYEPNNRQFWDKDYYYFGPKEIDV